MIIFSQANVALKAVFDRNEAPEDLTDDLLRFVQADRRAGERFVASVVKPLVEAVVKRQRLCFVSSFR